MAPSLRRSAAVLAVLVVVVLLSGMGRPAAAATPCTDCAAQCNSTCSAARAEPCDSDCNAAPGCSSCLAAYHSKCLPYCVSACKAQSPAGYDCEGACNKTDLCSSSCSAVCGESPACKVCKDNYYRGCTSGCTSDCKSHCI